MAAAVTVSAADLSECTELNTLRNLYLKPIARLVIVVTMPAMKLAGSINIFSSWLSLGESVVSFLVNMNIPNIENV